MKTNKFAKNLLSASLLPLMVLHARAADNVINLQTIVIATENINSVGEQNDRVERVKSVPLRQATGLNDFLPHVVGVTTGGTSGMDSHIYVRGIEDKNLKITVDGARQENYFFHHAGSLAVDTHLIKKAEIAVGNNSVTLGNNAIGGAVAFTTVDAADLLEDGKNLGGMVKFDYGTNDKLKGGSATVFGKPSNETDFLLSFGKRSSDGGKDGKGGHIRGDDISVQNVLAKFSYTPNEANRLSLTYRDIEDKGIYPFRPEFGYSGGPNKNAEKFPGHNKSREYTFKYYFKPNDNFKLELGGYHTDRDFLLQGLMGGGKNPLNFGGNVTGITARTIYNYDQSVMQHKFIVGGEYYTKKTSRYSNGDSETAKSASVYVEDQIQFGQLRLTPGVRFDHYKASKLYKNKTYNDVSGAFAAQYAINDHFNIFSSYTQFFNGPALPEGISVADNGAVERNDYSKVNDKAETGRNIEYGISTQFNNILNNNDSIDIVAKGFNTETKNRITRIGGTRRESQYGNAPKTTIKGGELSINYNTDMFGASASYSHARSKIKADKRDDRWDPRDTGDTIGLQFNYYAPQGLDLSARLNHVRGFTENDKKKGGYQIVDMFGTYRPQVIKDLDIDFGIYNLTDKYYSRHTSRLDDKEMGRNVKISATYKF